MSFVAFSANFAGTPPAPFAPFARGESVFYLVGIDTGEGLPAPGAQLSADSRTVKGGGRYPVDTVTETAQAWQGRRRRTVATRSYRWERYTKGAKAAARDAAQWQGADGRVMVLWSHLVTVDSADALGYRTPGASTVARPGRRGVGVENNAAATVRGTRAAVLTADEERTAAVRARAYQAQANTRGESTGPSSPERRTREPLPAAESTPAAEAEYAPGGPRPEGLSRLAHVVLDVFDGPEARPFTPAPEYDPETDPGVLRFRGLDLG